MLPTLGIAKIMKRTSDTTNSVHLNPRVTHVNKNTNAEKDCRDS